MWGERGMGGCTPLSLTPRPQLPRVCHGRCTARPCPPHCALLRCTPLLHEAPANIISTVMASVVSGRVAVQMLVAVVVAVLITTLCLFTFDIAPNFTPSAAVAKYPGPDDLVIPIDRIMKSPVSIDQDDPKLIQRIRTHYLYPPSKQPYSLASTNDDPSMGQSIEIRHILGNQKNGFFVECGALDGETRSNTLVFEKKFGWQGVLIEGDPKNFDLVLKKNRKAWAVSACLSTHPYPNTVMFKQSFNIGKISSLKTGQEQQGYTEVQCLPLYSILLALNTTTIDYFSLDVEGSELAVLRTIPWDKVNIRTLSVEFIHGGEGKDAIRKYVESQGYNLYTEVTHPGWLANDFIFVKNGIVPSLKEKIIE
ncbi:protein Star [Procambarus clarkii]|uniref:protein Star n=1 Tax=Procambarus clarkii TaxID=6728 RepID=UPI001E672BF5|nr:protein Star-like [Procambarus clarkii]